jgi:hypothetical protein
MAEKGKAFHQTGQKVRLCKLKKDGKLDEISLYQQNPIVYCNKCKAKAADPSLLCNPRALKKK